MEPNRFGRKLGIGLRIASKMAMDRAQGTPGPAASPKAASPSATAPKAPAAPSPAAARPQPASPPRAAPPPPRPSSASRPAPPPRPRKDYVEPARRVGVGTRRFGQAFFGPLARVSGTLWLEITGLFFALFALFFAQNAWRARASMRSGPEHAHFVLYCVLCAVFVYFCGSSFVKARVRTRRFARQQRAR